MTTEGERSPSLSVVTPTFLRPSEVAELLENLGDQSLLPCEVVVVDGSDLADHRTESVVGQRAHRLPFAVRYVRAGGGAALQRNAGIDLARGDYVALIDDDVRLAPDFLAQIVGALEAPEQARVGCIAGCLASPPRNRIRWLRWAAQRALGGITTTEPGRYDLKSGHAVPRSLRGPSPALRGVDVVGSGCAVWRRDIFDSGLRFADYFRTFSYGEDFHLALRIGPTWGICDYGRARFTHLEVAAGRPAPFDQAAHRVINNRFIFVDIVPERSVEQELRFWLFEVADLFARVLLAALSMSSERWQEAAGHWSGVRRAYRRWPGRRATASPCDRSDEM